MPETTGMPERIHAVRSWIGKVQHYWNDTPFRDSTEYIRSDLYAALERERDTLREERDELHKENTKLQGWWDTAEQECGNRDRKIAALRTENEKLIAKREKDVYSTGIRDAWFAVWELCISLGMNAASGETGIACIKRFILELSARAQRTTQEEGK